MRSDAVKKGIAQAPQRSLMRALGLTEEQVRFGGRYGKTYCRKAPTMRSYRVI